MMNFISVIKSRYMAQLTLKEADDPGGPNLHT